MRKFDAGKVVLSLSFALSTIAGGHASAAPAQELEAGKILADGTVVGEKEALAHFKRFEPIVHKKLTEMDQSKMRKTFSAQFAWFQSVGNYRKERKCDALQTIQAHFKLAETNREKCISDILATEQK